jgi:hypothetical protein
MNWKADRKVLCDDFSDCNVRAEARQLAPVAKKWHVDPSFCAASSLSVPSEPLVLKVFSNPKPSFFGQTVDYFFEKRVPNA